MASTVTVADVKSIYKTSMSDDLIQAYIDAVEERVGACVDANYSDNIGKLIKLNLVAYMLYDAEGTQEVSSRRAPNGASVSYTATKNGNSLASNQYGRTAINLDTKGCWRALVKSPVFMLAAGPGARSIYPQE